MNDFSKNGRYDIISSMRTKKKPTRASMPKSALARLYYIDEEIASGKCPSTAYLAENWEDASVSTIGRDIRFMKETLKAPIKYDAISRGFYYSKPKYRIPMGFSGADELLALGMARSILAMYKDTPIYNAANNLLNSIIAPMAAESNSDWYENRIAVPLPPSSPVLPEVWHSIITALRENRILTFDYKGEKDEVYKPRRVWPYQLLFDSGLWYLYGYAVERNGPRVYSLCRMKKVIHAKSTFSLPKNFDYRAIFGSSHFGIFAGVKKYHFKIAFYGNSADWVKERKWADDQKITDTENGVIITFTSTQFEKVTEWMFSRGSTARPLEPELLVTTWLKNIEDMQKLANSVNAI
jgi:predicted DNA-binding transcriptional regulator YafY